MEKKNLSRRDFLRLSAVAASGAALAACAPQVVEVTKEVPVEQTVLVEKEVEVEVEVPVEQTVIVKEVEVIEQVNLRFTGWVFGNWADLFDNICADFHEANPDITVTPELGDWTANQQKLFAEIAAGVPPDLGMGWWHQLIAEGKVLDLKPYVDVDTEFTWENYFPFCQQWARLDPKNATTNPNGGMYIFPMAAYAAVCYYNKTLFDEAGVDYPTDDWEWTDVVDKALALTKDTSGVGASDPAFDRASVDVWGTSGLLGYYFFMPYAWAVGSDVLDPTFTQCTLGTDPNWWETYQFFADLANVQNVLPGGAAGGATPEGGFQSGKVAMAFGMNWVLAPYVRDITDFEWAMAPFPKRNGERRLASLPDAYVAFTDAKHHDETWRFMKFLESEEVNRDYIAKELPPPHMKVALSDEYLAPLEPFYPEAIKIGWQEGRVMQADRALEHWYVTLNDAMGSVAAGEFATGEEAAKWASDEVDRIRAEYIVE
jgi:multiple sugar transport system substrate-binding protein